MGHGGGARSSTLIWKNRKEKQLLTAINLQCSVWGSGLLEEKIQESAKILKNIWKEVILHLYTYLLCECIQSIQRSLLISRSHSPTLTVLSLTTNQCSCSYTQTGGSCLALDIGQHSLTSVCMTERGWLWEKVSALLQELVGLSKFTLMLCTPTSALTDG